MIASQSPPMSNSDREFLEGRGGCYDQFKRNPEAGEYYKRVAEAAGQDVTGKVYMSGLAEYPGDPRAWISDRAEAKKVVEERGWNAEGAFSVKSPREAPPPSVDMADEVVDNLAMSAVEKEPALAEKPVEEVRETIKSRHKPHWSKK
jgi:hypothetical protein